MSTEVSSIVHSTRVWLTNAVFNLLRCELSPEMIDIIDKATSDGPQAAVHVVIVHVGLSDQRHCTLLVCV